MFQIKTLSFVLEKEPKYNEEGTLLFLTKKFGLIRVTATGLYKANAKLASWTEPPSCVWATLSVSGEQHNPHYRLITLSPKKFFSPLHQSYQSLSWYFFYVRLLKHFLPFNIQMPKIFSLWQEIISAEESWLEEKTQKINFIYFTVKFLKIEGLCPHWQNCTACGEKWPTDKTAFFWPNEPGLLCQKCSQSLAKNNFFVQNNPHSFQFFNILSLEKPLVLPKNLVRVPSEIIKILKISEESTTLTQTLAEIFSRSKINDSDIIKTRNFLLIFLASSL